jgi:soluble lytic murein transglycosylase-like protein
MTAKSAPQLTQVQQSRSAKFHWGATLFTLAVALLLWDAGSAFLYHRAAAAAVAARQERALIAAQPQTTAPLAETVSEPPVVNSRYRALSEFLAKRYKVSQAVTLDLVTIAHTAGQQLGLDPLLIIAVIAVESRFNPIAESVAGAKGLMQVIPKYHVEKFRELGGEQYAVFDPETNILVGSRILKEYLARTGHVDSALQMYAGALDDAEDTYTGKVMSEKERLQQVLRKSPPRRVDLEASIAGARIALADTAR